MGKALGIISNATGTTGGGGTPPSSVIAITSVDIIDTTPDASGNPQKLVTVNFTPPSPLGTFAGNWCYCDMPDSSVGLSIADGTQAANGSTAAAGSFQPTSLGFFTYNAL